MIDEDVSSIPSDEAIDIDVPLRARHGATLRLLVASLGADAGFSIDEIDDLKLAVSEVFNVLIDSAPSDGTHRARMRLLVDESMFVIQFRTDQSVGAPELDPLAETILSSVTDEYHLDGDGVRLVKRAVETSR
ncbi:ATP-binding protein [Ilumatobacter sp.]|uniref:ATP-binding protein n=1 Tax=Ilumatobacter sp. TaxID=1967498 RepID=UPI003C537F99